MDIKPRQREIDEAAVMWNKTKDPKYKDTWYKLIKEFYDQNQPLSNTISNNKSATAPTVANNAQ